MLTREENELLCRIEPETAMGNMLRRYWIPACMSSELPDADGAPIRVRLLGEDLVAFRDTNGKVGVLDEYCSHRGASLVLARNEECGLRCLYHGWKFDREGNIVDMPAEPEGSTFKEKITHPSYPVEERGGLVWVYMGPREQMPPFTDFEWTGLPESQVVMGKCMQECNWVQAVEGDIDTSHAPILHGGEVLKKTGKGDVPSLRVQTGRRPRPSGDLSPRLEVQNTEFGFHYAGIYKGSEDPENTSYVRIVPYIAPFLIYIPPNNAKFYVPIDDHHTWHYVIAFSTRRELSAEDRERVMAVSSIRPGKDVDASFRHIGRNRENNYLQDREAMKRGESWTGIVGNGVVVEDMAVTETMGLVYDRSREHLGARDIAIIRMRRLLLDSVRRFQEGGAPIGLDRQVTYPNIRSWHGTIPKERPWQEMVPGHVVLDKSDVEVSV